MANDATPNPAEIYEKFTRGDSLSNEEVRYGAWYYTQVAGLLVKCGPTFALAAREARRTGTALNDFDIARSRK